MATLKNSKLSKSSPSASDISASAQTKNFLHLSRSDLNLLIIIQIEFLSKVSPLLPLFSELFEYVIEALVPGHCGKLWALLQPPVPEVREEGRHTGCVDVWLWDWEI